MNSNKNEKRYNSKLFRFFDLLYRLLVINILTIIISIGVITFVPAVLAMFTTIKHDLSNTGIIKPYFKNFKQYFLKGFFLEILLIIIIGLAGYGYIFWTSVEPLEQYMKILIQAGVVIMALALLVISLMIGHIPHIVSIYPKMSVFSVLRLSLFLSIRYILTTLILLVCNVLAYGSIFLILYLLITSKVEGNKLVVAPLVNIMFAIWIMFGMSLPKFLAISFTKPLYYKLEQIDFKKINEQIEEDLKNE